MYKQYQHVDAAHKIPQPNPTQAKKPASPPRQKRPQSKKKMRGIAGIGALLIVACAVGALLLLPRESMPWFDSQATTGSYAGKTEEEIKADLNRQVKEGMMNISIASRITFESGTAPGLARIENIAANPMDQKVTIALRDTGEIVYESGALAPGQHIKTINLTRELPPGTYDALATFTGYKKETHEETGTSAAEIVLHVSS